MHQGHHEFGEGAEGDSVLSSGFRAPDANAVGYNETGGLPDNNIGLIRRYDAMAAAERLEDQRERDRLRVREEAFMVEEPKPLWNRSFPFGAVVNPNENSLRGYKRVLRIGSGDKDIEFSPGDYSGFDGIIARAFNDAGNASSPAINPNHPEYITYAPLRRNIAILRNYLLVTQFKDGVYSPGNTPEGREDARNFVAVQQMAQKLGEALAGGRPTLVGRFMRSIKRLVTGQPLSGAYTNKFMEAANVPDAGIAVMYEFLFAEQYKPSWRDMVPFLQTPRSWGLKPRLETPFSPKNFDDYSRSSTMCGITTEFDRLTTQLRSVSTMKTEDKKISVDLAREILERLKLLIGNSDKESTLTRVTDPHLAEARLILKASYALHDTLADITAFDPTLLTQPMSDPLDEASRLEVEDARNAMEQLNFRIKKEAQRMYREEGLFAEASVLEKQIEELPATARTTAPTRVLLTRLDSGIQQAARLRQMALAKSAQVQRAKKVSAEVAAGKTNDPTFSNASITKATKSIAQTVADQQAKSLAAGPQQRK